jgi:hypothetical protein
LANTSATSATQPHRRPRHIQDAHTKCTVPSEGLCQPILACHPRSLVNCRRDFLLHMHTTKQAPATTTAQQPDSYLTHHVPQQADSTTCINCPRTARRQQLARRTTPTYMERLLRPTPHAPENRPGLLWSRRSRRDILWSHHHDQQWLRCHPFRPTRWF